MNTDITFRQTAISLLTAFILCLLFVAPASAAPITYTYDTAGQIQTVTYPNGYSITYTYDNSGNRTASEVSFTADTDPEPFAFASIFDAALNSLVESTPISIIGINAPAAVSITGGEYSISTDNGATWSLYSSSSPSSIGPDSLVKVRQTSAGTYATETVTTLTIGGISGTFSVTTIIDVTPPVSAILTPENGSGLINSQFTIDGIASDIGSSVAMVDISINGSAWTQATGTTNWTYNWINITPGTYTIQSRATDSAGNIETPSAGITAHVYAATPSSITVGANGLAINNIPFTIRGVNYSPVPIGEDPYNPPYGDYFTSTYSGVYNRDLPLIRQIGANTVRLWRWDTEADHKDFLDAAYNNGNNPIYVIAGYHINFGLDLTDQTIREAIKEDFRAMVQTHKDHPAILLWALGDDLNNTDNYASSLPSLFSLMNEMAAEAHTLDSNHPVIMPLADDNLIQTITGYNSAVSSLDIWGVNAYRGNSFGSLFTDYQAASAKPLLITGYGVDAYNDSTQTEDQTSQATYATTLWSEIAANSTISIGGIYTEYSDQWWKGMLSTDTGCPEQNNPSAHGDCGIIDAAQPDGYDNFEWWGLMRPALNGPYPDQMTHRAAYNDLWDQWLPSIYSISGNVGSSLAGTTLTLSGAMTATTTTDISGNYGFSGLRSGDYIITPAKIGYSFVPQSRNVTINNASIAGQNFNGYVSDGAAGPVMNFDTLPGGQIVQEGTIITDQYVPYGAEFYSTAGGGIVIVGAGEANSMPNFVIGNPGPFDSIIMDIVDPDTGAPSTALRVEAVLISVGDALVTATAYAPDLTTLLDSVAVTHPGTGNGFMAKDPISMRGANIARVVFDITNTGGYDGVGIDDIIVTFPLSISGIITGAYSGVTVNLTGTMPAATTTDVAGRYSFSGLLNGSYTITPSKTGTSFSPTSLQATVSNAAVTGQNFTATLQSFTIYASAGSGGAISPSGAVAVSYGSNWSFSITPDTGYHITDVLVDASSVGAVTSYTFNNVTANHSISASFGINTYTVTPSAGPNGSISPNTPQTVSYSGITSFTITPDDGYQISAVTGCSGSLAGSIYTTGPITADCAVTASFSALPPVAVLDNWTNIHSSAPNNSSASNLNVGSFTVGSGSQRLLLVAVVMETASSVNKTISATYGGTALIQIGSTNNTQREIVWMGYLTDTQIGSGSKTLNITYSGGTVNVTGLHVKWSSFTGANQTTPVAGFAARNINSSSVTFDSNVNYLNKGITTVVSGNGGSTATGTLTATPVFTAGTAVRSRGHTSRTFITAAHTASGSYASSTTVNWTGGTSNWSGLVAVSLRP